MPSRCSSSAVDGHAELRGGVDVGLRDDRQVALRRADDLAVALVVGDALEVDGLLRLALGRQRLRVAVHLELHADLEELERRELADRGRAGELLHEVERALQAELGVALDGEREPHVELVVAQVVVADAGVRVDDLRRAPGVLGIDLRGDEHRAVAERARVEDRRDLADDPLVEQALDALEDLVLGDPGELGDGRVGLRREREAALHEVQQLAIDVVHRDRGAALAGADLRDGGRHV